MNIINAGRRSRPRLTVGIPRSLLFYRYKVLWKTFFEELGVRVIASRPTDRGIVEQGASLAMDEMCLAMKIFMGHVKDLCGRCDYILVPRVSNFGIRRVMCSSFIGLYDITRNIFYRSEQEFLTYNVDLQNKHTEEEAFREMGMSLGFSRKECDKAYKAAKRAELENYKERVKRQEAALKQPGTKILVAAHSYVADDPYFGRPVLDYLKKMGVTVIRADLINRDRALKTSAKMSPTLKWEFSREIVGGISERVKDVNGIILLSMYPCGPDSMVDEMLVRKLSGRKVPMLHMVLDAQSGTAGVETRLESFIDIIHMQGGKL